MTDEAALMRIYLGEADRLDGRPLFETILRQARESGIAGATVLRGVEGFGERRVLHSARLLRLSEELPLVIEIVDRRERLDPFARRVGEMFEKAKCGGLMTFEKVEMRQFGGSSA